MRARDIEKLLGGYATGTLTDAERSALFEAALTNQDLFNALADEQALKDLLDDPGARSELLAALEDRRASLRERLAAWTRRPAAWAMAGSCAALAVAIGVVRTMQQPAAPPQLVAEYRTAPAPSFAPAVRGPQPAEKKKELRPQAIRYAVLRQGADMTFTEAAVLRGGDRVRLRVEPDRDGYLALIERAPSGATTQLAGLAVRAGGRYLIPEPGAIELPEQPGQKRLQLVLRQGAEERPEAALPSLGAARMRDQAPAERRAMEAAPAAVPAPVVADVILSWR